MNWAEHCINVVDGKPGFPIVEIVWKDAVAFAADWAEEAISELRITTTVGYLVSENDEALSLVALINSEHVGHGIVIPKSCVVMHIQLGVK